MRLHPFVLLLVLIGILLCENGGLLLSTFGGLMIFVSGMVYQYIEKLHSQFTLRK